LLHDAPVGLLLLGLHALEFVHLGPLTLGLSLLQRRLAGALLGPLYALRHQFVDVRLLLRREGSLAGILSGVGVRLWLRGLRFLRRVGQGRDGFDGAGAAVGVSGRIGAMRHEA
jgi:hypothetical protein